MTLLSRPGASEGDRSPPLSFMPSQRRFPPPWSVEDTDSKAAEGVTTTALPSSPYVPCIHSRASRGVGTAMGNRWSD
jgi:hypothetical protein